MLTDKLWLRMARISYTFVWLLMGCGRRAVAGIELIETMELMLCLNMLMLDSPLLIWQIYVLYSIINSSLLACCDCICALVIISHPRVSHLSVIYIIFAENICVIVIQLLVRFSLLTLSSELGPKLHSYIPFLCIYWMVVSSG